jgi:hypothetical protein
VDSGSKLLPSILAGTITASSGLSQIEQAWKSLPAAQKKPIS